jgi:hypothetical protein
MRILIILSLAVLANCAAGTASTRGVWPSLAKRPVESAAAADPSPTGGGAAMVSPALTAATDASNAKPRLATANPASLSGDVATRMTIAARDIDNLEQRWRVQLAATQRAAAAARTRPDTDATATAQLESGRLDKLSGQLADELAQLETIAGQLASAAAAGVDVTVPLRSVGSLLDRCAKLIAEGAAASDGAGGGARRGDSKPR